MKITECHPEEHGQGAGHPLELNSAARIYFERLLARASNGPLAVWREAVETCTGGLPSWAARKYAARVKA